MKVTEILKRRIRENEILYNEYEKSIDRCIETKSQMDCKINVFNYKKKQLKRENEKIEETLKIIDKKGINKND